MTRSTLALVFTTALTATAAPNLKSDPRFPGAETFGVVRVTGERMPSNEFTISPNGAEIIAFGYNRGYSVYDVAGGKWAREGPNEVSYHDITFSSDGKLLATAEWWSAVKRRDPKTGKVLDTLKPDADLGAFHATFLPDGKLAAYCWRSDRGAGGPMKEQLAVWDPVTKKKFGWDVTERTEENGKMIRRRFVGRGHLLSMHTKYERGLVVDRSVTLTDPATNKESKAVDLDPDDFVCDASPDGKSLLVSHRTGNTRLIDVATGKVIHKLVGHKQLVTCGAFAPDGKRVATASGSRTRSNPSHWGAKKQPTDVILWDVETGKEKAALRDTEKSHDFHDIKFCPDGRYLAATTLTDDQPGKGRYRGGELILWGRLPASELAKEPATKTAGPFPLAYRLEKFIDDLATSARPADQKVDALFLVILGRFPTADERERAAPACKESAGVQRMAETLIDTKEFREHAEGLHKRLGGGR